MRRCLNCMQEYQETFGDVCPGCGYVDGATMDGGSTLRPGTILQGRYIVGTVKRQRNDDISYIGWDALFDRRVMLQEYFPRYCAARTEKPELSIYDSRRNVYEEGLRLFCTQSRELIRLYKEEDVVTYHGCFMENNTAYAAMDWRDGQTLRQRLEEGLPDEDTALRLLSLAIRAVEKAHRIGVFHGMLDLESFWITGDDRLILKDFGGWRYVSGEPGVVYYGNAGPETDVYGLAKVFCQMMTGRQIDTGDNLDMDLLRSKVSLSRPAATAMKHALSHEVKSLERFREELGGISEKEVSRSFLKNRSRRRDARDDLSVSKWLYAAAAAGIAAAASIALLVMSGVIDVRMGLGKSQIPDNMVRVPNVEKREADEAEKLLRREDLEMSRDKMVFSDEVPANLVSYQEIPAATLVDRGTEIVVWISMGKEKGVIPALKGRQREEAEALLKEAGFTNVRVEESQEPGIYNSVLDISEVQGDNVELDKEIVVTVCANQTIQDGNAEVQVQVPDVSGMSRAEAETALEQAGLKVQWMEEFSEEAEGTILGQEPEADTEVNKDSIVAIRISVGEEKLYMVNVELEEEADARTAIEALGLTVGKVTKGYSGSVKAGAVISQSIAKGEEVKKGASVDLVISLGRKPEKQTAPAKETSPVKTTAPAKETVPETTAPEKETAAPETTPAAETISASEAASSVPVKAEEQEPAEAADAAESSKEESVSENGRSGSVIEQGKAQTGSGGPKASVETGTSQEREGSPDPQQTDVQVGVSPGSQQQ